MLRITKDALAQIIAHAQKDAPIEACGYLIGNGDTAQSARPLTNVDQSEEHFSFDPKEQFAALKAARLQGLKPVACYHSHPASPARPSREDIRLAFDPGIHYVIVSLAGDKPDVRSFKIVGGVVEPETLEVTV
ncbi:MAG: M67 family metallopeptidase [Burkholderiales bacterium]|jgi:proteasome lid subunit RPN8/RPN11|nr:M67 family metallopeptidase [Burkholderiales bacterium]